MKGKKQLCAGLTGILLAISALPCAAEEDAQSAETYKGEGFTLSYIQEETGASVVGCSGDAVSVTVPATLGGQTVVSIGEGAFNNCGSIASITLPDTVTEIGDGAFFGCQTLKEIALPKELTKIGYEAFYYCAELESITLPDKLESIGEQAFYYCPKLTSITLPASVTVLGDYVFEGCEGLTEIRVQAGNPNYCDQEGVLFNADRTQLIKYPDQRAGDSYTLPDSTVSIADWAFVDAKNLVSLDLGSVTEIGKDAFYTCTALEQITIPEGVTALPGAAFGNCTALRQVQLPDSLTELGAYCFVNCSALTELTVPGSVSTIGDYALGYTFDADTDSTTKQEGFTLRVQVGSVAANYAKTNGIAFEKQGAWTGIALVIAGGILLVLGAVILIIRLKGTKQEQNTDTAQPAPEKE